MKAQHAEIKSQEEVMDKMNRTLKDLEKRLKECEEAKKVYAAEVDKLKE